MFYLFLETLSMIIRNFTARIFRLGGGPTQLGLLGSDRFVLRRDGSVASNLAVPEDERSLSSGSRFSC